MTAENRILTLEEVHQTFLDALNSFGVQLKELTEDMKAVEVVTAVGTTTADIMSSGSDLTSIANGKAQNLSAKLKILARTRFELDGDLLVILPTKQSVQSPNNATPSKNNDSTVVDNTEGNSISENEPVVIDKELLDLHKENVNMALQNLQFVYGKIMDIASKFADSSGKGNILNNILGRS
jgi:hypothetical protein